MKKILLIALLLTGLHLSAQWTQTSCYIGSSTHWILSDPSMTMRCTTSTLTWFLPGGSAWNSIPTTGLNAGNYTSLMANDQLMVFYSTEMYNNGMAVSLDMGKTWTQRNPPCSPITSSCLIGQTIILFDLNYQMYYSTDNGANWSSVSPPAGIEAGSGMCLDNVGNDLFMSAYDGSGSVCIYKSTQNLTAYTNFQLVHNAGVETNHCLLGVNEKLFCATGNGIEESDDKGQTWRSITYGMANSIYSDTVNLYAFYYSSHVSKYNLATHEWTDEIVPGGDTIIYNIQTCNGIMFADLGNGSIYYGLYRYVNNTWKLVNGLPLDDNGVNYSCVKAFWNGVFTGAILQDLYGEGVYSSTDQGGTFTKLAGETVTDLRDAWFNGTDFLVGGMGGAAAVHPGGSRLTPTTGMDSRTVFTFEKFRDVLYAGTDDGIYTTANDGLNWTYKYLLGKNVYKLKVHKDTLYAATDQGLLYTANGPSWGVTTCPAVGITDIVSTSRDLYVLYSGGILRRVDSLQTQVWLPIGTAIVGTDVNSIANNGERLIAGTQHGSVLYSDDHGKSWTDISDPSWSVVRKLDVSGTYLFAAESNTGVWKTYIGAPIGMDDSRSLAVKTYPNPVKDQLFVEFPGKISGAVTAELLDITGRQILNADRALSLTGKMVLDLATLKSGMYFLRLVSGAEVATVQVVKE